MIKFDKLKDLMKEKGVKKINLRKEISPAIVDKMLSNGNINTVTLNKVCAIMDCQPGDIMEYVPDETVS